MAIGVALTPVFVAKLAVVGVACVAGVAGAAFMMRPTPSTIVTPATFALPQAAVPVLPAGIVPSFDVVRVGPQGNAVIAGRAEPGANVVVTDGAVSIGETRANSHGEWVLGPTAPLAPGGRELSLSAQTDAGPKIAGTDTVLLAVPAPAAAPTPVMALLVPRDAAPRILQGPSEASRPGVERPNSERPGADRSKLALGAVDYDDRGDIRFAGTAPPGSPVRVYVDNKPAGDAIADARGAWAMTPRDAMAAGVHQLRVDQLTATGRVMARVELPFQRTAVPPVELASGRVVVQPGQSLWRLARQAYGTGVRYTVIYLANRDQIRDPRLIYPGQAFAVPTGSP